MTDTDNAAGREAMDDKRLEQLAGLAELPCSCDNTDCQNFMSALTAHQAQELAAEAGRARALLAVATARAEQAETRLAELGDEWRVEWGKPRTPSYDVENATSEGNARYLAGRSESAHVQTRQATPWRDVEPACRSCATTERVLGNPPLCTNCAAYAPPPTRIVALDADDTAATDTGKAQQ